MPGSHLGGKPVVKKWLADHPEIGIIVDLGPGEATYPKQIDGPEIYSGRGKYIWKAVEIWGPYIKRFDLTKFYDEIRIGDIRYMEFPTGDCCIAGDVLEHLSREDFIKTFQKIDGQFKYVIISVPINLLCDDNFEGNPFESHLSYWTVEELDKVFGPKYKREIPKAEDDPCVVYFKDND